MVLNNDSDFLVRMLYCPKTGIVSCHGFSFDPYTSDLALTQILKSYRKDHCYQFEDIMGNDPQTNLLAYKCNEHTSKNGSIKVPFNSVFMKRNVRAFKRGQKELKRDSKTLVKANDDQVFMVNNMNYEICHQTLSMKFREGHEDVMMRKRQKTHEVDEFIADLSKSIKLKTIFDL
jgi:hypothetical protein